MNISGKIKFFCLSSGSDSNCFYLGVKDYGILIDAGLGVRKTIERLSRNGVSIDSIKAIFITHDHIDHVRAVASLGERRGVPVFATEGTIRGINNRDCIKPKLDSCVRYITKESPIKIGIFEVTAFEIPHDAYDCVGYSVRVFDKVFTFLTDLGHITDKASQHIAQTNYLVIEANHDIELLNNNPNYPQSLKERIKGDFGHLSNQQTAEYLVHNLTSTTSHIWLCHLSLENNTPEMAYKSVAEVVKLDVHIYVFKHGEVSDVYYL